MKKVVFIKLGIHKEKEARVPGSEREKNGIHGRGELQRGKVKGKVI